MNGAAERTYWVHDLNPILISFTEQLAIRWYGLAYLAGFLSAWGLMVLYRKSGRSPLNEDQEWSLMFYGMAGVLLGGRMGYVLLYEPAMLVNPLSLIAIWQGGMASHGGFAGVIVALALFARKNRLRFWQVGDMVTTLVPAGLLFGRLANFINGELWGKPADVPWAVIFPTSAAPGTPLDMISPRHPSQLYEAALEGLLLLIFVQLRFWRSDIARRRPGVLGAEFLVIYAVVRVFGEMFREPDADLILGLSRGIFYSILLGIGGIGLLVWRRKVAQPLPSLAQETPSRPKPPVSATTPSRKSKRS